MSTFLDGQTAPLHRLKGEQKCFSYDHDLSAATDRVLSMYAIDVWGRLAFNVFPSDEASLLCSWTTSRRRHGHSLPSQSDMVCG